MSSLVLLVKVGAVKLSGYGNELVEEGVDSFEFLLARLPVDVMIPEFVGAEFQAGARDRSLVQAARVVCEEEEEAEEGWSWRDK